MLSKQSTQESLAQISVSVSKKLSVDKKPLADKDASASLAQESLINLVNKDPLANKKHSANIEPLASEEPLANKEISAVFTKESPVEIFTKQETESVVSIEKENLSELIKSNSINTTIKSLENIIRDASNTSHYQAKNPASESIMLPRFENDYAFQNDLAKHAERRLQSNVTYDGRYLKIGYPMGDVPANIGVCTDVVIRAYRGLGIDLQQRVHEDMKRNFRSYPNNWQLSKPDSNIDHRRVPNLMEYFKRAGAAVAISSNPLDYHAGDIVAWDMGNGLTHIGIVSTYVSDKSRNPLIVHNIGEGPEMTDILFDFKIIGHYQYGNRGNRKIFKQKIAKRKMRKLEANPEVLVF